MAKKESFKPAYPGVEINHPYSVVGYAAKLIEGAIALALTVEPVEPAPAQEPRALSTLISGYAQWAAAIWGDCNHSELSPSRRRELVMVLGLGGETAEVVEELLNAWSRPEYDIMALVKEMGDAFFCWAMIATTFEFNPAVLFTTDTPALGAPNPACAPELHLVAASGQIQEIYKKHIRDGGLNRQKLEAGLVAYAMAWRDLCETLGLSVVIILEVNREKLNSRHARGTLRGSGNDR